MSFTQEKLRILYVENGIGYGGAIICLRHLVRNLNRERYQAMLVTGRTGPEYSGIGDEAIWRYIPDRHLDVPTLQQNLVKATWPSWLPGSRLLLGQVLARLDDLVNFLPFFFSLLWTAWRFRPAIIHVNNEPLCNRAALLVGRVLGVPTVAHVRGDQKGSQMMGWAYSLPTYFVAVSRWVSESIGRIGVPAEKRTFVYDGIELEKLDLHADGSAFRQRFGIPPDACAVGLVGLLIPWKGQELFLTAMRRLLKDNPKLWAMIVGGTPEECVAYEVQLRQMAADPPFCGRVVFTGHVSDMAQVYNCLDVVVSASTSPEPLGTMIIESMAMARPLVAPDHGGALEMMEHERTGLLFKAGDAVDLAEQIDRFSRDKDFGRQLGAAARQHALQAFAVAAHVSKIQAIYEHLLSGGKSQVT